MAEVAAVVAAAEGLARTGRPAEDAAPMVQNYAHDDVWTDPPETTSIEVLDDLAKGLGDAFERAEAAQHLLYRLCRACCGDHLPGQQHRLAATRRTADRPARAQCEDG